MDSIDVEQLVEQHFPYDGPHSQETFIDALYVISGLVRYANNATRHQHTVPWAATVYRAVRALQASVSGLDQLTQQLSEALGRLAADDASLYDDRRSDAYPARDTALAGASLLLQATRPIAELAERLNQASEPLSHLGND